MSIIKVTCLLAMLLSMFSASVLGDIVQYRVSTGNDDAEERDSDGDMYRDSSDLEFSHDDYFFVDDLQIIGMRF